VIKGETDHYEYVVDSCRDGLLRVSLDESTPIVQGILVCREKKYAQARANNGTEYAQTALHMKKLLTT
jgi:6,7-dimethyl-8-ribityllumazine synthase